MNIPGIVSYIEPGAYTVIVPKVAPLTLNAGRGVICILGRGKREEVLVIKAAGNGLDGEPAAFRKGNKPDGRHFKVRFAPVINSTIEVFINPTGDPEVDLPLIRITSTEMAELWASTYGEVDGYDGYDSLDGVQSVAQNDNFWNSKYARQYALLKERLGITTTSIGTKEPNHYVFDPINGTLILDQPLKQGDTLVVSYIAEGDINSPQIFTSMEQVVEKHGYPSKYNTIALGAQVAFENGASSVMCVHAGQRLVGDGSSRRLEEDPYLFDALKALEKEEEVSIIVPIIHSRVYDEVAMPFYEQSVYGSLTGNGAFLQESPEPGDQPGINITPLKVYPAGSPKAGEPVFLRVYKNGKLLEYGIDYSIPNLDGSPWGQLNSTNTALIFSTNHPDATHINDNTLQEGDRIVVSYLPDPDVINLVATAQMAVISHCNRMSQVDQRMERTAIFGAYEFVDTNFILNPITGIKANFGDFDRCMFIYPSGNKVTRVVGGEIQELDGQIVAAAAAGYLINRPVQESLTNKILIGFNIPQENKLNREEARLIGGAGVAIVKGLSSGGKVIHGKTTSKSGDPRAEEYNVVRIKDFVSKELRRTLQDRFIGMLITPNLPSDIAFATESLLRAMKTQGIIYSFNNVSAAVDVNDPRQINVKCAIRPVYTLTWIYIEIVLDF